MIYLISYDTRYVKMFEKCKLQSRLFITLLSVVRMPKGSDRIVTKILRSKREYDSVIVVLRMR